MFHLHISLFGGSGDGREDAKLGDGQILELLKQWGPFVLALFGIKLPPLPWGGGPFVPPPADPTSGTKLTVQK